MEGLYICFIIRFTQNIIFNWSFLRWLKYMILRPCYHLLPYISKRTELHVIFIKKIHWWWSRLCAPWGLLQYLLDGPKFAQVFVPSKIEGFGLWLSFGFDLLLGSRVLERGLWKSSSGNDIITWMSSVIF